MDLFNTEPNSIENLTIIGLDEAGRGPLAGPVCAGAVILGKQDLPAELNDSKQLSEMQRLKLEEWIKKNALSWSVSFVWPEEIDAVNIHGASLLAMKRAFQGLKLSAETYDQHQALCDGKYTPDLPVYSEAIIKGDGKVPEIMAASILAKNARDRFMEAHEFIEKIYEYGGHKGYPTELHYKKLAEYGASQSHRKSFNLKL